MTSRIYTSSFRTGENATKKQQMLFATDTAFALSEGYQFIKDCDGDIFQILDEHNLIQVIDEEVLNQSSDTEHEPSICSFDPYDLDEENTKDYGDCEKGPEDDICTNDVNIRTIDFIIFNTLNQNEPIRSTQLDSLIKLAQLKILLGQCNE